MSESVWYRGAIHGIKLRPYSSSSRKPAMWSVKLISAVVSLIKLRLVLRRSVKLPAVWIRTSGPRPAVGPEASKVSLSISGIAWIAQSWSGTTKTCRMWAPESTSVYNKRKGRVKLTSSHIYHNLN